jgi:RNA polymerase sigma-70 factor, ECF subfamily
VQESFAKALKSFSSFQQGTNFQAWMFRILRNTFLTSRSRAQTFVSVEEEGEDVLLPPERHTPESILLNAGLHERLQTALARLPVQFREVLLLCDVEDMKYQEIADMLELPIGTVMSRISRGRRLLRGMLAEDELRVGR